MPTIEGRQAFVPDALPERLDMNPELVLLQDDASRAISMLARVGETVQNPHLLIRPLMRREAVLSSRIEGTNASLTEVFAYEARGRRRVTGDVDEVWNYVDALEYGIDRLATLPISFRLVNELHARILAGVRGQDRSPGRFREGQVWIGPPGSPIQTARFVPPPHQYLRDLFLGWERFVNDSGNLPPWSDAG